MGRRCVAFVVDGLTIVLVIWIAAQVSRDFVAVDDGCPDPVRAGDACFQWQSSAYVIDGPSFWRFAITLVALLIVVLGATRWRMGSSLGKALLDIRVVDARGRRAGFWRGAVRTAALAVDGIVLVLPVGLWLALFTPGHRRLGDFCAGTFVVRARRGQVPVTGSASMVALTAKRGSGPPSTT